MCADMSEVKKLSVGSLLGHPLGAVEPDEPESPKPPTNEPIELSTEEAPATIVGGNLRPPRSAPAFDVNGVEDLSYDNPFNIIIEQVWFDQKVVYAADLGQVDVDSDRVKVAQEYQIVYGVELDERGKTKEEPPRVPGQLNIYDSVPGMERYSPIWQFNYVVVPRDYQPNSLRSEGDCLTSGYPIYRSQVFEN
jgi:hypothetical protein